MGATKKPNGLKVRPVHQKDVFSPFESKNLFTPLIDIFLEQKKTFHYVSVPGVPLTLNHQTKSAFRNGRLMHYLRPEVQIYRRLMAASLSNAKGSLSLQQLTTAMIFVESNWITKKNTIRKRDVDNLVKPVLDAYEKATGYPDENVMSAMPLKIHSSREMTHLVLWHMSDIIPSYT